MKGWYVVNSSKAVIVFVHGLFSDSAQCWTSKCGVFWPDLLKSDSRFNKPSIFLAEFYTAPSSNDFGVSHCAKQIYDLLKRQDDNLNSPPIEKQNIIFVAHSAGGIIVRYMLECNREAFAGKNIGLCLYASPSYGSRWASYLGWFAKLFNNKLARELAWGSAITTDLDSRFKELLCGNSLNIKGVEVYENNAPFDIPFMSARIVEELSAARYFGRCRLIPKSNHSSIVKPVDVEHLSHAVLLDLIVEEGLSPPYKNVSFSIGAPSLFDRYKQDNETYYVKRDADGILTNLLKSYSVWVCGESGSGKTAAITRSILRSNINFQYISLSTCVGQSCIEMLGSIFSELSENYSEVSFDDSNLTACIKSLAQTISGLCRSSHFVLFIEEIPIDTEEMFKEFSNYIYMLIANIEDTSGFRLVLSSIFVPNHSLSREMEKISERMRILGWARWNEEDIKKLVRLVAEDIGFLLEKDFPDEFFEGNPRKVKNYFRDEIMKTA